MIGIGTGIGLQQFGGASPIGTIFDILTSDLSDLSDFTSTLDGSAAAVLDSGLIKITGAPATSFGGAYLRYDGYTTGLQKYKYTVWVTRVTAPASFEGFVLNLLSSLTTGTPRRNDGFVHLNNDGGAGDGQGYRYFNNTAVLTPNSFSGSPLVPAVAISPADDFEISIEASLAAAGATYTMTIKNLTAVSEDSGALTYTYTTTSGQLDLSTVFFGFGTTGGTHHVSRFKLETTELKNPDFLVRGDSMTAGYETSSIVETYVEKLKVLNPGKTFTKVARQNDRPSTAVEGQAEIELINARRAILFIGTNEVVDVSAASALASYASLVAILVATGMAEESIIHVNCIPRGPGNDAQIVAFNSGLASTYTNVVDLYSLVTDGSGNIQGVYTIDGVHLNDAGNTVAANAINTLI